MHELSIAESIVRIANRHAAGRTVCRVDVKVGHLRQVVPSALEFAFELIAAGTPVEGAELALEAVPVLIACSRCGCESELEELPLACPACASYEVDVLAGEELVLEALELELEDEPAMAARR